MTSRTRVVDETQRRPGLQDLGAQQSPGRRLDLLGIKAGDGLHHRDALPVTDDGDRLGNGDGIRAGVRQPRQHRPGNSTRTKGGDHLDRGDVRPDAIGPQGPRQFVQQERVATGDAAAVGGEGSCRVGLHAPAQHLGHSIDRQRLWFDHFGSRVPDDLGEGGVTRRLPGGPEPGENDHRKAVEPPAEIRQEPQR